jgi:hypothetical protein
VLDGQGQWQLKGGLSPDGVLPSLRLEEAERQGGLPAAALRLSLQRWAAALRSRSTATPATPTVFRGSGHERTANTTAAPAAADR